MNPELNHTNAALKVCVDRAGEGRISGRVYSRRLTECIPFADVADLLLRLDAVLDEQNFPQAFQRARSFTRKQGISKAAASLEEGMSEAEVSEARGEKADFILYILSRRNASWQGRVEWLDGTESPFESALELIKLTQDRIF